MDKLLRQAELSGSVIIGGGIQYPRTAKVYIGDDENGYERGDLADANAIIDLINSGDAQDQKDIEKLREDLTAEELRAKAVEQGLVENLATKADKVTNAMAGNFAGLNENGNIIDSGSNANTFATPTYVNGKIAESLGAVEAAIEALPDGQAVSAQVIQHTAEIAALQLEKANKDGYYESMGVGLADNLESWSEDLSPVSNTWDETIRSTAGDDPIVTEGGGMIEMIRAKTDFKCTGLRSTAYNQLRLTSDGGGAVAVGNGWYFPVPKLELGQFGDASYNNGLLLTDEEGNNIQGATVYFKSLASGVPTSVTDGTACSYEMVTFGGKSYKTYVTSGEGWLIVSDIDYVNTCAHLAWEDWYDKFVSPIDAEDTGDYIDLSALFTAAPNGTGKFLVLGNIATYADRTDETHMLITDPIGRITSPSWTNTLQEDGETYLHSLTVSGMKTDGAVVIEGSSLILIVSGTTVSYSDINATAISGAVRYEKATSATATVTLTKTSYALNDCGVEVKEGAEGEGWMRCGYSQNIADALSLIAKFKLGDMAAVIAEALTSHEAALRTIVKILGGKMYIPTMKVETFETLDETSYNVPKELIGAGAPNANNIPENLPSTTAWTGVPLIPKQWYFDKTNDKWYRAKASLSNSVSDWLLMN